MASRRKKIATMEEIELMRQRYMQGLVTKSNIRDIISTSMKILTEQEKKEYIILTANSLVYPSNIKEFQETLSLLEARYILYKLGEQGFYTSGVYSKTFFDEKIHLLTDFETGLGYGLHHLRNNKMSVELIELGGLQDFTGDREPHPIDRIAMSFGMEFYDG